MNHILAETQGDFVAIECIDKLTELDFEIITPLLESQIEEYHKISLFVGMQDFHGWADGGLWADTKFELKHHGDFTRIAIVGDQKWEEWMATLSPSRTRGIAAAWIGSGERTPPGRNRCSVDDARGTAPKKAEDAERASERMDRALRCFSPA